ncbi:Protein DMSR-1 b [Aphelenchoides avenae]|nr:Protein DMSR-1 b [Aphelenchus avenae]
MTRCQTVLVHWPNASWVHDVVEGFSTFYHPIHIYISILLCVFGVAANIGGIYILLRPSMRTPPNIVLVVMSFCNLALVLLFVAYTARRSFFANCTTASWSYGWAFYLSVYGNLSVVSHASSVWLSVLLAFMRYVSLRLRKTQITTMQTWALSTFVIFLVFALNLPNSLAYTVKEVPLNHVCFTEDDSLHNATAYVAVISDVAKNSGCILFRLAFWISGCVLQVLPCFFLAFFIWRLLKSVEAKHISDLGEASLSSLQLGLFSSRDWTTLTLVAIVTSVFLAEVPKGVMTALSGICSDEFRHNVYNRLGDFFDMTSLLSASSTFVIYCVMSAQFRKEFSQIFLRTNRAQ